MLETLKKVGHDVGQGVSRAWNSVAEGWRELWNRSGGALTQFSRDEAESSYDVVPSWGMLTGDVYENDREIVVRLEAAGLDREDFDLRVADGALYISGEKRHDREEKSASYYLRECAYGRFERALPLPNNVDATRAKATCKNGVLTVRLPKTSTARRITVH